MMRYFAVALIAAIPIVCESAAVSAAPAGAVYAQSYPPGDGYPPSNRPPCQAVTSGPLRGAARGAAGGAIIGAISGNAGRGAAIGATFGGVRNAVRRGSARSAGACY